MNWLLLRGLSREKRHWGGFVEFFTDFAGSENVMLLDHAGIGDAVNEPSPKSIQDMTLSLRKRWNEQKTQFKEGQWGILSLSLGSMVSLNWCSTWGGDFDAQVIINTSSGKFSKPWERIMPSALPKLIEASRSESKFEREKKILSLCTNLLEPRQIESFAQKWQNFAMDKTPLRKVAAAQFLAAASYKQLPSCRVKTLALVSAADRLVEPSCTMKIANALGAHIEVHPGAGHELCLDDPKWVIEKVKLWI